MKIKRECYGIMRISDGAILCDVANQQLDKYNVKYPDPNCSLNFFWGSTLMFLLPDDITNEPLYTRNSIQKAINALKNKSIIMQNSNYEHPKIDTSKDIKVVKINEEIEVI